ncbi:unnamed protein product [Protopolystoma xenopodis]|uniref:Uncharacterized protein n=1 Tax=Protopolystoma xenopodis TaxID=117903 RepID=A0A448X8I8_9PLAT|nr:unnamed protein product [Protopolystoma xenopodis]
MHISSRWCGVGLRTHNLSGRDQDQVTRVPLDNTLSQNLNTTPSLFAGQSKAYLMHKVWMDRQREKAMGLHKLVTATLGVSLRKVETIKLWPEQTIN